MGDYRQMFVGTSAGRLPVLLARPLTQSAPRLPSLPFAASRVTNTSLRPVRWLTDSYG
jgi:hypothetical protein